MKRLALLLVLCLSLAAPAAASAASRVPTVAQAASFMRRQLGPGSQVVWCHANRYGVLCSERNPVTVIAQGVQQPPAWEYALDWISCKHGGPLRDSFLGEWVAVPPALY